MEIQLLNGITLWCVCYVCIKSISYGLGNKIKDHFILFRWGRVTKRYQRVMSFGANSMFYYSLYIKFWKYTYSSNWVKHVGHELHYFWTTRRDKQTNLKATFNKMQPSKYNSKVLLLYDKKHISDNAQWWDTQTY